MSHDVEMRAWADEARKWQNRASDWATIATEQVLAWRQKPRRALPKGKRPARVGRRGKREAQAWQLGRALVVERSGGFCEGPQVVGVHPGGAHSADHVHHVISRGRGGSHDPENLRHVHARPAWAQSVGLLASKLV